jgi:hypothetical protein
MDKETLEGRRAYNREYMREWRKRNKDKVQKSAEQFYRKHYEKLKQKEGE